MTTSRLRIAAATVGLCLVLGVVLANNVLSQEAKMRSCGVTGQTSVVTSFSIPHAADIDKHFPHASHFVEFENASESAFVVVFSGPVTLPVMGPAPLPGQSAASSFTFDKVVCVLVGDQPAFYYNVDTTGLAP